MLAEINYRNESSRISYRLKIFLHNNIYNKNEFINDIMSSLNSTNLFNIEYIGKNRTFNLKIKKTIIKKKSNYSHDSLFYYNIINNIFLEFLYKNKSEINKLLRLNGFEENIEDLVNINNIGFIYNITAIADNMVIIIL